ncbi:MAG: hypothetical protein M3R49_00240 [Chloroflexota bacterium]|nr:hypothetical protein [Chloroflexota bacterium]
MPSSELESLVVLAGLIVGTVAYSLLVRRRVQTRRRIAGRLRQLEAVLRVWWASREAARRAPTARSRVQVAR